MITTVDRQAVTLAHGARLKCPCCSAYHFTRQVQAEDPREVTVRVYECVRCRWRGAFAGADDRAMPAPGRTAIIAGALLVCTAVAGELYVLRQDTLFGFAAFIWPVAIVALALASVSAFAWQSVVQRRNFRRTLTVAVTFAAGAIAAGPLGYFPLPIWQRSLGMFFIMAGAGFVARDGSAGNSMDAVEQFNLLLGGVNAMILVLVAFVATLGLSGVDVGWLNPSPTSPLVIAANLAGPLVVGAVVQLVPVVAGLAAGFYARFRG